MDSFDQVIADLRADMATLAAESAVPGVAVALCHQGRSAELYSGKQSESGRQVDARSIFEVGSITKVWTATLIMQLVDEGLVDLEQPVQAVLPEFRIADEQASAAITPRHLLSHTPGFDGDIFVDTGEDAGTLERYIANLVAAPSFARPGELFSYCNAGIAVLGRMVEVLRGVAFDDALSEFLLAPLKLENAYASPFEVPRGQLVVGHAEPSGEPVSIGAITRGLAPTGSRLSMSANDLRSFGLAHLRHGAIQGGRILSATSVEEMKRPQRGLVPYVGPKWGAARGLGWDIHTEDGVEIFGHGGHTVGQVASLQIIPVHDLVLVVLTNGGREYELIDAITSRVIKQLTGTQIPPPVSPKDGESVANPVHYVGEFPGASATISISEDHDGQLRVTTTSQAADGLAPVSRAEGLRLLHGQTFVSTQLDCGAYPVYSFLLGRDGRAEFVHNGRAFRRRSTE